MTALANIRSWRRPWIFAKKRQEGRAKKTLGLKWQTETT